jgi:hypothetical protein
VGSIGLNSLEKIQMPRYDWSTGKTALCEINWGTQANLIRKTAQNFASKAAEEVFLFSSQDNFDEILVPKPSISQIN